MSKRITNRSRSRGKRSRRYVKRTQSHSKRSRRVVKRTRSHSKRRVVKRTRSRTKSNKKDGLFSGIKSYIYPDLGIVIDKCIGNVKKLIDYDNLPNKEKLNDRIVEYFRKNN